jgi:Holliday junction resolvase RusA-like endonuclease
MKIIISGRIPSKKNSKIMVCRGKFPMLLPSQKYTEWHKDAVIQLKGKSIIKSNKIKLTFYPPDKRPADLSNKTESIMDLLVDCGLIEDDNWYVISELTLIFGGTDKDYPRCEIEYEK